MAHNEPYYGYLPEGFNSIGCVGFSTALGGTAEGAQCLVDFLGPPYRVESSALGIYCTVDGFPYNLFLK
jgi:hypothetical protein